MKLDQIKALQAFRGIVQLGSATSAAAAMGMSQPAVSRLLAQLEAHFGFQLFQRSKGRLLATPRGLRLFDEVELALQGLERVNDLASDLLQTNEGHLRIVAPPSFAEGPLVRLVAEFLERNRGIHITIDSRTRPTVIQQVANRIADCGFGKLPLDHPGIRLRPLVTSRTVCVLPPGHQLGRGKTPLEPAALVRHPLILVGGAASESRLWIDRAFADAGLAPNVRLETHNVGAACALAAEGVGIAIVNELLTRQFLWTGITLRPFSPALQQAYVFMTSAHVPESRATGAFYRSCSSVLGSRAGVSPRASRR